MQRINLPKLLTSLSAFGFVLVCAAPPAFAQEPIGPGVRDDGWVSGIAGAAFGSQTQANATFAVEYGDDMQADIGSVDFGTVVISQTQTDVTAVVRSASTGLSCRYSGTAGPGAFALHTQACEVNQILFRCANGASRVLEQVGSTATATLGGGGATGTVTTFYNVFSDSTEEEQRRPVAGLVLEEQFNAVRR